jgi:hypothetical protein
MEQQQQQQQQRQQQQQQLVALPPLHPASFDKLDPSRKDDVYLYYEKDVKKTAAATDGQQGSGNSSNYRYKLTIVDRPIIATATNNNNNNNNKLAYATAVFLIPAGREAEYMFSSIRGLQNIAASAGTARLIAVAFGRHDHLFASQQAVQQELAYVVQILARQGSFLSKKSLPPAYQQQLSSSTATVLSINDIPFMALDGIGQRNVIAQGTSAASGPYLVEQVTVDDNAQVRRLYFMNNSFVIQTEVFLSRSSNSSTPTLLAIVDKSRAAFDYHKIMAAGILALSSSSSSSPAQAPSLQGLLIGLGGGGLVNYMSHVWPPSSSACMLTAIELDPTMVDIATKYFGVAIHKKTETNSSLEESGNNAGVCLDVRIGNGLDISVARDNVDEATNASITVPAVVDDDDDDDNTKQTVAAERAAALAAPSTLSFATGTMSFVVIDVDSKDNSKGMSCPPQSFIEVDYLERLSQLLLSANETGGVLAINVSARDPEMLQLVCRNVNQVFDTVILSNNAVDSNKTEESSEDVNVVVFAMKLSRNENDDDDVLSSRSVLTDRLATLLRLNPNVTDECMSDLKSAIQDFSLWKSDDYNDDDDGKLQQRGKKSGGGEGRGKKNKKKNKRGGKKK